MPRSTKPLDCSPSAAADNTVINGVNQGVSADNITITRSGGNSSSVSMSASMFPEPVAAALPNDAQDAFVSIFPPPARVTVDQCIAGDGKDISLGSDLASESRWDRATMSMIGGGVTLIGQRKRIPYSNGNDSLTAARRRHDLWPRRQRHIVGGTGKR